MPIDQTTEKASPSIGSDNNVELTPPADEEAMPTSVDQVLAALTYTENEVPAKPDKPADESASAEPVENIPARLKGKPLAQVYDEFAALEREYSRQGNELGETRALLRKALEQALKGTETASKTSEEPDPSDDEFVVNPKTAVRKLVEKELKPLKEAVLTAEQRAAMLEFEAKHPGYQKTATTAEFQDWVKSSPYRTRLFKEAAAFDMDAAEDLFTAWEEHKASAPATTPNATAEKIQQVKRLKTETGSAGKTPAPTSGKKIFRSAELARLYIMDRDRYNAMADEIRQAFAEGRVR